jgi:proteasome lid subunit RPN8/RPN11
MKGLTGIERILILEKDLQQAFGFLRYAGTQRSEGVALFAGVAAGSVFHVKEVIIPKQTGYILESGLMYAVDGSELHKINVWLYSNDMELISQIHSHPSEAYHSEADDRFPIVDTYGGLSIVVPDFATGRMDLNDWAIYRLSSQKTWDRLRKRDVEKLIQII